MNVRFRVRDVSFFLLSIVIRRRLWKSQSACTFGTSLLSFLRIEGFFKPMKPKCHQKLHVRRVRPFASSLRFFGATADVDFEDFEDCVGGLSTTIDESATERPGVRTADEEG